MVTAWLMYSRHSDSGHPVAGDLEFAVRWDGKESPESTLRLSCAWQCEKWPQKAGGAMET